MPEFSIHVEEKIITSMSGHYAHMHVLKFIPSKTTDYSEENLPSESYQISGKRKILCTKCFY